MPLSLLVSAGIKIMRCKVFCRPRGLPCCRRQVAIWSQKIEAEMGEKQQNERSATRFDGIYRRKSRRKRFDGKPDISPARPLFPATTGADLFRSRILQSVIL